MATERAAVQLSRFLVELVPARDGFDDIQAVTARSRAACRDLAAQGTDVRFLRTVFLPEDGTCLLLFDAPSAGAVEEASRRASLGVGPISEVVRNPAARGLDATGGSQ